MKPTRPAPWSVHRVANRDALAHRAAEAEAQNGDHRFDGRELDDEADVRWEIRDACNEVICRLRGDDRATADLIASAPLLLERFQRLARQHESNLRG